MASSQHNAGLALIEAGGRMLKAGEICIKSGRKAIAAGKSLIQPRTQMLLSQTSPLLKLPLELKYKLFSYILPLSKPSKHYCYGIPISDRWRGWMALVQVCRELRSAGLHWIFSTSVVDVMIIIDGVHEWRNHGPPEGEPDVPFTTDNSLIPVHTLTWSIGAANASIVKKWSVDIGAKTGAPSEKMLKGINEVIRTLRQSEEIDFLALAISFDDDFFEYDPDCDDENVRSAAGNEIEVMDSLADGDTDNDSTSETSSSEDSTHEREWNQKFNAKLKAVEREEAIRYLEPFKSFSGVKEATVVIVHRYGLGPIHQDISEAVKIALTQPKK
ncbi:MAG: hypothetical protein M1820_000089 [Bogoriella megaspora]|nr:MAG: hypothetical protein M1820_000089 [Bogoriella megaspora]